MINKYYGLTNKPNNNVEDKSPQWMDDFFKKMSSNEKPVKKSHPFEGIDDPILNPQKIGVKKDV